MKQLYKIYIIIFLLLSTPLESTLGQSHDYASTCTCRAYIQKWENCLEEFKNNGEESLSVTAPNLEECNLFAESIGRLESLRVLFLETFDERNKTDSIYFMEQIANPYIEVLYLDAYEYYKFPPSLSGWSYLDTLIMKDNSFGILRELNKTSFNNIQKYSFSELQDTLKKYDAPYYEDLEVLADLAELKYAKLNVCYLPKNINKNKELRHLEIRNSDFYFIPKTIIGLDKLHTFEVETYYLKQVPSELFELGGINKIVIRADKVADFPSIIKSENLQFLGIAINDFIDKSFKVRLKQLPELKTMFIAYASEEKDSITPIRFNRLSALESLTLKHYPHHNFSKKSKNYPNLKDVTITHSSKIKLLSLKKTDNLEYLSLRELGNLEKIRISKKSCKSLQELYVSFAPKLQTLRIPETLENIEIISMYGVPKINWTALPEMGETLEEIQLDTLMRLKNINVLKNKSNLKIVEMKIMSHQKELLNDLSYLARTSSAIITVEMPNLFVDEFIRSIDQSKKLIKTWSIGDNASKITINRRY